MAKISPYQLYDPKDWSGLTTQNNLGQIFMTAPYLISDVADLLYEANVGSDVMRFINQFPEEEVPAERFYEWMLQGQDDKNIPLVEAQDIYGTAITATFKAGLNKGRFKLVFNEDWFDADHVIVGEKPDLYHVRIVEKESLLGSKYVYTCELVTNNVNDYIPYLELVGGTLWSIDYTLTESTLSTRGTGTHHTSPFRMRNEMSFMRKEYTVPGNMIEEGKNQPLAFKFRDAQGKTQSSWINKLDFDFMKQFRMETSRLILFGKSNRLPDGSYYNRGVSGYDIKAGAGFRDQIAPANINYYNKFSLNQLVEFCMSLSVGKLPEDSRRFVIFTGEYGLRTISKAIEQTPSANALMGGNFGASDLGLHYARTDRYSGPLNSMKFSTGQFSKFAAPQGIELEFVHVPHYDDEIRNKINHPTESGLAESHRMTIVDFGTQNGKSNIVRMKPKGGNSETYGYIPGLRDPYSPGGQGSTPKLMASPVDGYTIHRSFAGGICIKNPLRTGEFIPSIIR